ncbi:hypothetical protein ACFQ0O_29135 [Saccharopolyspora spinosporotrichia]
MNKSPVSGVVATSPLLPPKSRAAGPPTWTQLPSWKWKTPSFSGVIA